MPVAEHASKSVAMDRLVGRQQKVVAVGVPLGEMADRQGTENALNT